MKKLLIILICIILLAGCSKGVDIYDTNDNFNEKKVYQPGEVISLDIENIINKYDYSKVEFNSTDEEVARINYKEELITLSAGRTTINAKIYDNDDLLCVVNLGEVIVIDYHDSKFIPINNNNDLKKIKAKGFYYLNKDLYLNEEIQISAFNGILINPNKHKITGKIGNSQANISLFNKLSNAYIDGLIFDDIEITGGNDITSTLASEVDNSLIKNVNVRASITSGYVIGGVVGKVNNSVISNCSFNGNINDGLYIGGIAGISINSNITNSYVIANLSSINLVNKCYIASIVGLIDGGKISSSYFAGNIEAKNSDNYSVIAFSAKSYYYLLNVYYIIDSNKVYDDAYCLSQIVYHVTEEDLKSGEKLVGLSEFTFIKGEYPFI